MEYDPVGVGDGGAVASYGRRREPPPVPSVTRDVACSAQTYPTSLTRRIVVTTARCRGSQCRFVAIGPCRFNANAPRRVIPLTPRRGVQPRRGTIPQRKAQPWWPNTIHSPFVVSPERASPRTACKKRSIEIHRHATDCRTALERPVSPRWDEEIVVGAFPQGDALVVLHKSRETYRPVHGAFREAVVNPAFMPGKTGADY